MSPADLRRQVSVRPATTADRPWIEAFLDSVGATRVARRGELVHAAGHPMLLAIIDEAPAGLLTYIVTGDACEILTLHTVERGRGTGTALLDALLRIGERDGWRALRVLTTNDNLDALRFYQRRGFRIRVVRPGAVDDARAHLKPEIPEIGDHGIPIRDEIELERAVDRV